MGKMGNAADLARLLGVSKVAVGKGLKGGRLKKSATKKQGTRGYDIDLELAVVEWHENNGRPDLSGVDHRSVSVPMAKRKEVDQAGDSPALDMVADEILEDAEQDEIHDLVDADGNPIQSSVKSRRILDHFKAQQARLEYMAAVGAMVPIEEIGQAVGKEYASVRAALLSIPAKLADELAVIDSVAGARALLEAAISDALNELTLDAEPAPSVRAA